MLRHGRQRRVGLSGAVDLDQERHRPDSVPLHRDGPSLAVPGGQVSARSLEEVIDRSLLHMLESVDSLWLLGHFRVCGFRIDASCSSFEPNAKNFDAVVSVCVSAVSMLKLYSIGWSNSKSGFGEAGGCFSLIHIDLWSIFLSAQML